MKLAKKNDSAAIWKLPLPVRRVDFRRLGLKKGEARTSVIRNAASKAVRSVINDTDVDRAQISRNLAEIVVSTYRLLDPRRRRELVQRVQLILCDEFLMDGEAWRQRRSHGDIRHSTRKLDLRNDRYLVPAQLVVSAEELLPSASPWDVDSIKVLAVQEVVQIIQRHERRARINRLQLTAAVITSALVMASLAALACLS